MHRMRYQLIVLLLSISMTTPVWAGTDWKITLKVSGSGTYGYCVAGIKGSGATDGYDKLWDMRAMLSTMNSIYIYSYFPHPEWDEQVVNFSEDIKASGYYKEWLFEVNSNSTGQLTIEWPDLAAEISDYGAMLVDLEGNGEEINMQTVSSFTFQNNPSTPRQFQLIVQKPVAPMPPVYPEPDSLWCKIKKRMVRLNWTRSTEPLAAGYHVYRKVNSQEYERINPKPKKKNHFVDRIDRKLLRSPTAATLYYKVETVDNEGNSLHSSNEVEVTLSR